LIVEHEFVTTRTAAEALDLARAAAASLGFAVDNAGDARFTARRGKSKVSQARSAAELPQRLDVAYDRGRVSLAVFADQRKPRPERHQREMQLAIAGAVERHVTAGEPDARALAEFGALEQACAGVARRARVQARVAVGVLLAFLTMIVVLGIVLAALA